MTVGGALGLYAEEACLLQAVTREVYLGSTEVVVTTEDQDLETMTMRDGEAESETGTETESEKGTEAKRMTDTVNLGGNSLSFPLLSTFTIAN